MNIFADRYQFRARIAPEFLTLFPLLLVWTVSTDACSLLGLGLVALFFFFLQGQYASILGRKLQRRLRVTGDLPSNGEYVLKLCVAERRYSKLFQEAVRKSGMEDPFSTENERVKRDRIEDILTWLRVNTWDKEKFSAVFDKNCDYGWYRNMLALKYWAIGATILALVLLVGLSAPDAPSDLVGCTALQSWLCESDVHPLWLAGAFAWIVLWSVTATEKNLDKANDQYLRALLRAVAALNTENTDGGSKSI